MTSEAIKPARVLGMAVVLAVMAASGSVRAPSASAAGELNSSCPPYPCLDTAAQVSMWDPGRVSPFERASVPLADRVDQPNPGMLVGLDNGAWSYWSEFDLSSQGSSARGNVYNFSHWQYVDTLYYYRHSLLAVPPAVWIDAAHRNGVAILGTLTGDCTGCSDEFQTLFQQPWAVDQLALMASTYGFDGWLFDVEGTQGNVTAQEIAAMYELRTRTLPDGQPLRAVYYQAGVTTLDPPQDATSPFYAFLAAGEHQTDYQQEGHVDDPHTTYQTLKDLGMADRRFDTHWASYVYAYETEDCSQDSPTRLFNGKKCLDIATLFDNLRSAEGSGPDEPAFLQGLSLFAPAWGLFGGSQTTADPLPSRDVFTAVDDGLWEGTGAVGSGGYEMQRGECLLRNPDANAVATMVQPRSPITRLPFATRFNTGEGDRFWVDGRMAHDGAWNLLSAQDVLPTAICTEGNTLSADITYDGAYDGGSQLRISGQAQKGSRVVWLYESGAQLPRQAEFGLTFKTKTASLAPNVAIWVAGKGMVRLPVGRSRRVGGPWVSAWVPIPEALQGERLSRIGVAFGRPNDPAGSVDAAIGELAAIDAARNDRPVPIVPRERRGQLTWTDPAPARTSYYNVWATGNGCRSFAGRTLIRRYDLAAPLFAPLSSAGWVVQPVSTSGRAARITTPAC